ncbi:MAG: NAD(P)/FAD-dependent oxidoreductase [Candidatus Asgardarchaeia archaeon]
MPEKVVIIGANAAGTSAALWGRKFNRRAEIVLIGEEPYPEYSRCGLPYAISGEIPSIDSLILHPKEWYEKSVNVRMMLGFRAEAIDTDERVVEVRELNSGESSKVSYDSLIIATGSLGKFPPIEGLKENMGKGKVFSLRSIEDAKKIKEVSKNGKSAIVIGAGLIGVEAAEALTRIGLKVSVVEFLPHVLPAMIDEDMSRILRERMVEDGVSVHLNTAAKSLKLDGDGVVVDAVNRETGEEVKLKGDFVIVATGVRPNTELAKEAGIELGKFGGIKVDEKLMTNVEDVYAAGDCVETKNIVTGKPFVAGLGTVAVRQGRVAGVNALGGELRFPGSLANRVTKVFGVEIAAVGLTEELAKREGIDAVSVRIRGGDREPYYPDRMTTVVKVTAERPTGRIIGAQVVGRFANWRSNIFAIAIERGLSLDEVVDIETCYAPPVAPVWDPIAVASMTLSSKLRRVR